MYTVHNLAYQGLFPQDDCPLLGLSSRYMTPAALEFHGQLSFMKAGLAFADRITTVSPTYAREIATAEFGAGLEGLIRGRGPMCRASSTASTRRCGTRQPTARWRSATARRSCGARPHARQRCSSASAWPPKPTRRCWAWSSRLNSQKGLDLVLSVLPDIIRMGAQLAVQGSGDPALEAALRTAAAAHPGRMGVLLGYDEVGAHRLIAGADMILVPSRFEPCGLTQMYGLRYGSVPIVRQVGGLADTVRDLGQRDPAGAPGNGFVFDVAQPQPLRDAIARALQCFRDRPAWVELMQQGMSEQLSWDGPARQYMALYQQLVGTRLDTRTRPAG